MITQFTDWNALPLNVSRLVTQVNDLDLWLREQIKLPEARVDKWMDIDELCQYLPGKPKRTTIYERVRKKSLPCHRRDKELYFLKSEIDEYLKEGKRKTAMEIKLTASKHLNLNYN